MLIGNEDREKIHKMIDEILIMLLRLSRESSDNPFHQIGNFYASVTGLVGEIADKSLEAAERYGDKVR